MMNLPQTIIKVINRFFGKRNEDGECVPEKIDKKRIDYRTLCLIGEEFVAFHNQTTIQSFVQWLKREDKTLWKANKCQLQQSQHFSLPAFLSAISDDSIRLQDKEQMIRHLRAWNRENRYFFFIREKKFIIAFAGEKLLEMLYEVKKEELVAPEKSTISAHIKMDECIKICLVGMQFNEKERDVLDMIVEKHNKTLTNWKIFNDDTSRAKEYVASNNLNNVQYGTFNTFRAIPPTEVEKTRHKRYKLFHTFGENAETTFTNLCEKEERTCRYRDIYSLNICYGSRNGMDNSYVVEVFWGQRIYDNQSKRERRFIIEQGCTLFFQKQSSGLVNIFIIPGGPEDVERKTYGIAIFRSIEPKKLCSDSFLCKLWHIFVSFTECTSLDGMPTPCQKICKEYYSFCKRQLIEGEIVNSRFRVAFHSVTKWVVTIGLSGCLLSAINALSNDGNNNNIPDGNAPKSEKPTGNKISSPSTDTLSPKAATNTVKKATVKTDSIGHSSTSAPFQSKK